eukprot:gene12935-biopygen16976
MDPWTAGLNPGQPPTRWGVEIGGWWLNQDCVSATTALGVRDAVWRYLAFFGRSGLQSPPGRMVLPCPTRSYPQ